MSIKLHSTMYILFSRNNFQVRGKLSCFHTVGTIFTNDRLRLITCSGTPKFRSILIGRKLMIECTLCYFITLHPEKMLRNSRSCSIMLRQYNLLFHWFVMFNLCNGLLIRLVNRGLFFDFRVNGLLFSTNNNGRTGARRGFRNVWLSNAAVWKMTASRVLVCRRNFYCDGSASLEVYLSLERYLELETRLH